MRGLTPPKAPLLRIVYIGTHIPIPNRIFSNKSVVLPENQLFFCIKGSLNSFGGRFFMIHTMK